MNPLTMNLKDMSRKELIDIKEKYVAKYIGDWDKPTNYMDTLRTLLNLIEEKS